MNEESRNTFRLAAMTSVATVFAYGFGWPLAYITPLFVWNYLKKANGFGFRAGLANLVAPVGGCLLGLATSTLTQHHPVVFLLATALLLWLVFYLNNGTLPFDIGLWLIIGLTLVPMLTIQSQGITMVVIKGLWTSAAAAVGFGWLGYLLFPVVSASGAQKVQPETTITTEEERWKAATVSLAMVLPVIVLFFSLNLADQLLIMIFIAIIAQDISLETSRIISFMLLASNVIGGLAAIVVYNLLLMVPEFLFMIIVMSNAALVFAALNYRGQKSAPLFGMAFTTTLLIVGAAVMPFSDGAPSAVATRVGSILVVVLYFVIVLKLYRVITVPRDLPVHSERA